MNHFDLIREWARDRNLIDGSTPAIQALKGSEEWGETCAAIARGYRSLVRDGIGDMIVVLTIIAAQCGLSVEKCIEAAWNEIKDRKGQMRDGVFVKEEDL